MENQFKVGDRITVKNSVDARIRAFGKIGTITHIESMNGIDLCRVKYDFPRGVRYFRFYASEIDLAAAPELKPCPFCGVIMNYYVNDPSSDEFTVCCGNCGAIGPNELTETRAIEMWNLRRPEAALETLVTKIGLLCAKSMNATATLNAIIDAIADDSKGK